MIIRRERKSPFVRLFDKTPADVVCPHFYELILSNGCPYHCEYCYLKLTFRGRTNPTLFTNSWDQVKKEIDLIQSGVFSTGELADSLAIIPPLLEKSLDYFSNQSGKNRYLLLLTKSTKISILRNRSPDDRIIVSFSVNSLPAAKDFEKGTPSPIQRVQAAAELKNMGWRVRIRIDPIILESGFDDYEFISRRVAELEPELVTIGSLRQFPGLFRFAPKAPKKWLKRSTDGRMRYSLETRVEIYEKIESWLGFRPSLCKETKEVWNRLGWEFSGCNCTANNGLK